MINKVDVTGTDEVTITHHDGSQSKMAGHVWNARLTMIKHGLEWEIRFGGKMTNKAPSCFTIIKNDFDIRGRDKKARYHEFCRQFGFEPRKDIC